MSDTITANQDTLDLTTTGSATKNINIRIHSGPTVPPNALAALRGAVEQWAADYNVKATVTGP